MSVAPIENQTLRFAARLAERGYLVFPCKPFSKAPATANGFKDATTDPRQIAAWFDNEKGYNLAVACGAQPNEVHLLAIDIDPKNGGDDTWALLTDTHGVPLAPRHDTPSGGFHLFFDSPLSPTGPHVLGQGIDTRGTGGYVVVPPSRLTTIDGELITYRTTRAAALAVNAPPAPPQWLVEALQRPDPVAAAVGRHPARQSDEDSLYDLIRSQFGPWPDELAQDGWIESRGSGGDRRFTRPGKDPRNGHSATLHPSGAFVVFTQTRPFGGKPTNGADGATFSPAEYVLAYRYGGDRSALARAYRTGASPRVRAAPGGDSAGDGQVPPAVVTTVPTLNLEPGFWDTRSALRTIRQAAHRGRVSPDALLVHALARSATLVPPSLRLPALVGRMGTLDFIGCVVAETADGKSASAGLAADLVPDPTLSLAPEDRMLMFDRSVGSGEGIAQAFMVEEWREDDEGKKRKTGRQVVGRQALHLIVDEGMALMAQAGRQGATIIPTLCSAWSGAPLGQQNAAAERVRVIDAGRVRVTAVINMQSSNAHFLFTPEMAAIGFTGRTLFAHALDPNMPAQRPASAGTLNWPVPPSFKMGVEVMTYDPAIEAEIDAYHVAKHGGTKADLKTGHGYFLRCKVAALLSLWEGSKHVDLESWALAGQIVATSTAVITALSAWRETAVRDQRHTQALARAETEMVIDDAKERRAIASMADTIRRALPPDGMARGALRKKVTAVKSRHRFEAALDIATRNGWVAIEDGKVFPA